MSWGKTIREKNGYSPFCNEMVVLYARREFLDWKDNLGPAHKHACIYIYVYMPVCALVATAGTPSRQSVTD